jgi:LmbE family N-acetylglucosaminyl deacetylase
MSLEPFPEDWQRATVIAAHPDDIEWGIAAAVAAWTAAGKDVTYVLVTSGEAGIDSLHPDESRRVREAEERASAAIVGVSEIEFLGFPDGRVVEDLTLRRAVGRATMDAVADAANRWIFPDLDEPPWTGTRWVAVQATPTRATHAVDIEAVGDAGVRSLLAHEQYLRGLGVDDLVAYATTTLEGQVEAVRPHVDGRRAVAFELTPV